MPSYTVNRDELTRKARAMDGDAPLYSPATPLSLTSFEATSRALIFVLLSPRNDRPWMFDLMQSRGKLMNQLVAPLTPPARGIAALVGIPAVAVTRFHISLVCS